MKGIEVRVKPIFHCKLGSRWITNLNEMSTNNMKCIWPARKLCIIFHWLALAFCVGVNANSMFRFGGNTNFSVFRYQYVGIPNFALGVLSNINHQR